MLGIEILSTSEVAIGTPIVFEFNFLAFILSWLFITIIGALFGWLCDTENKKFGWLTGLKVSFVIGLVLAFALGTIPTKQSEVTIYETHYKVVVSDKVSINEFLAQYELISQDGKVYTVKERADYVPQVTEDLAYWSGWEDAYCSKCEQFCVLDYVGDYTKYCTNCGTKMDLENTNHAEK